jgi:hypothetical protein
LSCVVLVMFFAVVWLKKKDHLRLVHQPEKQPMVKVKIRLRTRVRLRVRVRESGLELGFRLELGLQLGFGLELRLG